MSNLLSFDFEDWYQIVYRDFTGELIPATDSLPRQLDKLMEVLDRHNARATFFVLGMAAETFPSLIKKIAGSGHELAVHGYAHLTLYRTNRGQFHEDTCRAKGLVEDLCGKPVLGYRATAFSIVARSLWALEELADLGFKYDSSVFPIRHRRYGIPGFPMRPERYLLPNGKSIIEIPLATSKVHGLRLPVAGGGYFRILPYKILRMAIQQHEADNRPFMTYFHPYEFDSERLDIFKLMHTDSWQKSLRAHRFNWHQNLGRKTMIPKLDAILSEFEFTTCQEFLNDARCPENSSLLSSTCATV
jgi:polysaccharide deacetylase family protein (PEP-CTERM system associated)